MGLFRSGRLADQRETADCSSAAKSAEGNQPTPRAPSREQFHANSEHSPPLPCVATPATGFHFPFSLYCHQGQNL